MRCTVLLHGVFWEISLHELKATTKYVQDQIYWLLVYRHSPGRNSQSKLHIYWYPEHPIDYLWRKFSMNGIIRLLCPRARDLDQLVHGWPRDEDAYYTPALLKPHPTPAPWWWSAFSSHSIGTKYLHLSMLAFLLPVIGQHWLHLRTDTQHRAWGGRRIIKHINH